MGQNIGEVHQHWKDHWQKKDGISTLAYMWSLYFTMVYRGYMKIIFLYAVAMGLLYGPTG